jgi:hypothetical protein
MRGTIAMPNHGVTKTIVPRETTTDKLKIK